MTKKVHTFNVLIILFVAGTCYHNILNGMFVFDDTEAILKNQDLNPNNSLSKIFQNDFWGTSIVSNYSHKSYRPLTVLFYRLNIHIVGYKSPVWFHSISIILYMIVCATLYALLSVLLVQTDSNFGIAFSTALLFSVHPVHTEVVSSVVGQADLLCSLVFFLAVLAYNRCIFYNSIYLFIVTLLLSAISMFCKETGITVLGICSLYDTLLLVASSKIFVNKRFIFRQIGLASAALFLLYARWNIMNFTKPTFQHVDNPASFAEDFWTRVLSYNYIYFLNVLLLIWPQWLCFDWSMGCISLLNHFLDIRFLFVLLLWSSITIFIIHQIIKRSKLIIFSVAFCIIPFLPASNLWLRVGFVLAERTLFLPSVGFCLLVSCGFHRMNHAWNKFRKLNNLLFILLCILFMCRSWQRSKDWLTEYDLFNSALAVCPNNAKVHYNIAKVSADNNEVAHAENEYRKAIQLHPTYDQAMNNLANLLRDKGNLEEAKELLTRAVNLRPEFATAWMNLGIVLATLNLDAESESSYLMALKHRKNYSDCYYNLGNLYLKVRRNEEALLAWERAVLLNPSHSAAWSNTLVLLDSMGLHHRVLDIGQAALSACPGVASLHFTLANTLGKLERWQDAEYHFQTAIELNPHNALYHSNFGVLYHRWGQLDKAVYQYDKALNLDPNLSSALRNRNKIK